jgi:hypothetical protein
MGACASVAVVSPPPPPPPPPPPTGAFDPMDTLVSTPRARPNERERTIREIVTAHIVEDAQHACDQLFLSDGPPPPLIPCASANGWSWTWRQSFGTTEIQIVTRSREVYDQYGLHAAEYPGLCVLSTGLVGSHRVTRAHGHIPLAQGMLADSCRHQDHIMRMGAHAACGSCLMRACAPTVWDEVSLYNGVCGESKRDRICRHEILEERRSVDRRAEKKRRAHARQAVLVSCDE